VGHSVTSIYTYIDKCWLSAGVRGGVIPIYNSVETATLAVNLTEDAGTPKIAYLCYISPQWTVCIITSAHLLKEYVLSK